MASFLFMEQFDIDEDDRDEIASDYFHYEYRIRDWLESNGIGYSFHDEPGFSVKTPDGGLILFKKGDLCGNMGYIFVRSDGTIMLDCDPMTDIDFIIKASKFYGLKNNIKYY